MLYNFEEGNSQLDLVVADGYKVDGVLFGKVAEGTLTMDRKYAYLTVSKK
jgi:hypothetical protein